MAKPVPPAAPVATPAPAAPKADDEPVFTVRASDPLAAPLVRQYAQTLRRVYQNARANSGGITDEEKAKVKKHMELVEQMREWRRSNKLD